MKQTMLAKIGHFLSDDEGATAVEYSVMLAMIVLLAIAAILSMGNETSQFYDYNAEEVEKAL